MSADRAGLNEAAIAYAETVTGELYSQLNSSLLLFFAVGVGWFFLSMVLLRRVDLLALDRRRWRSAVRAVFLLSLMIGLLYVWAPELRTFALSIVAFAVAIVIATKELILCVLGGLYRLTTGTSKIGDRVRVGDERGEIIDQTLFAMTLQELDGDEAPDMFTGHQIIIPNSVLLHEPVINESDNAGFGLREIVIPLSPDTNVQVAQDRLLKVTNEVLAPLKGRQQTFERKLNEIVTVPASGFEPLVSIKVGEGEKVTLMVRFFAPADEWSAVRNGILKAYLHRPPAANQ